MSQLLGHAPTRADLNFGRRRAIQGPQELEIYLEELGQQTWWRALFNTLTGDNGSAQYRFVARPPAVEDDAREHAVVGAAFPMMRWQDLDNVEEPNGWLDVARERLQEIDRQLVSQEWQRRSGTVPHWWSITYRRPS